MVLLLLLLLMMLLLLIFLLGRGNRGGDVEDGLTSEREREAKLGRFWVRERDKKARSGRL